MRAITALLLCLVATRGFTAPVCVEDSLARQVCLDEPARRIVTLAPHLAENVFSAGAGAALVGATRYSDYPPESRTIPRVGDFNAFSLERIAALAPDLLLVWGSGNGNNALANLEKLGFTVYVDELRQLQDIPASIRNIGRLAGTVETAEQAAAAFTGTIEALKPVDSETPLRVFYQIWNKPLQTVGGDHLISEVIRLCGGSNIFADNALLAPQVSLEAVLQRDPQVIVASGTDRGEPPWLQEWQRFPEMTAVRAGNVSFINPDTLQRPTIRLTKGARQMCELISAARGRL